MAPGRRAAAADDARSLRGPDHAAGRPVDDRLHVALDPGVVIRAVAVIAAGMALAMAAMAAPGVMAPAAVIIIVIAESLEAAAMIAIAHQPVPAAAIVVGIPVAMAAPLAIAMTAVAAAIAVVIFVIVGMIRAAAMPGISQVAAALVRTGVAIASELLADAALVELDAAVGDGARAWRIMPACLAWTIVGALRGRTGAHQSQTGDGGEQQQLLHERPPFHAMGVNHYEECAKAKQS